MGARLALAGREPRGELGRAMGDSRTRALQQQVEAGRVVHLPHLDRGDVRIEDARGDFDGTVAVAALEQVVGGHVLLARGDRVCGGLRPPGGDPDRRRLLRQVKPGAVDQLSCGLELLEQFRVLGLDRGHLVLAELL